MWTVHLASQCKWCLGKLWWVVLPTYLSTAMHSLYFTNHECRMRAIFQYLASAKDYLRSTMSTQRTSSLALINIHYAVELGCDRLVEVFARKHSRRLLLADMLSCSDWEELCVWTAGKRSCQKDISLVFLSSKKRSWARCLVAPYFDNLFLGCFLISQIGAIGFLPKVRGRDGGMEKWNPPFKKSWGRPWNEAKPF